MISRIAPLLLWQTKRRSGKSPATQTGKLKSISHWGHLSKQTLLELEAEELARDPHQNKQHLFEAVMHSPDLLIAMNLDRGEKGVPLYDSQVWNRICTPEKLDKKARELRASGYAPRAAQQPITVPTEGQNHSAATDPPGGAGAVLLAGRVPAQQTK